MAQETILGGSGILWGDEKVKINSNYDELYLQAFTTLGTAANVVHSTINLTGANGISAGTASTNNGNINLKNSTNGFYFDIAAGVFTENHKWTLPVAYPLVSGALMTVSTAGVLAYTDSYERHIQVPAQTSGLPANQAPLITVGTSSCLSFVNAGGKYAYFQWEIPSDWVAGTEDIIVEVDWLASSGAVGASETVVFDFTYVSIAEGEAITGGTDATAAATFTDAGAGTAQYLVVHTPATLAYNDANQPLAAGDHIFVQIERGTDTFTGDVAVTAFEIIYNSNGIPMT